MIGVGFMRVKKILPPLWFTWLVLCLPIALLGHIVWLCGINVVYMDDFEPIADYIKMIASGSIDWSALVAQHNEHRIVFPRIFMHLIASFTNYNTKAFMMFSVGLLGIGYLIFVRSTIAKTFKEFTLADSFWSVFVGLCLFNFCQQENLLWGFQIAWFLIEFCVISGVAALDLYIKTNNRKWLITSIVLGIVSSFSSLHGLAIWPCYTVVVGLSQIDKRKFSGYIFIWLILSAVLVYGLYFTGYHAIANHSSAKASSFRDIFEFFFINLGSVLAWDGSEFWRFVAGLSEFVLTLILGLRLLIKREINNNLTALGVIIFSFGISLMLGIGRSGWTMPSRYMTFPLLAVIGNLAILHNLFSVKGLTRWLAQGASVILVFACLYVSQNSLANYHKVQRFRVFTALNLVNYKNMPLQNLRVLYPFKTHEEALKRIGEIEKHNLSTFYDLKGTN